MRNYLPACGLAVVLSIAPGSAPAEPVPESLAKPVREHRHGIDPQDGQWLTSQTGANDTRSEDLSDIWMFAKENIYPKALEARFLPEIYEGLHARLQNDSESTVADVINPFLASLGVSHTRLYDEHDLGYYMFRSMFTTRDIESPKVVHIGVQTSWHEDGLLVDAVLEPSDRRQGHCSPH
jgi:hypothetical protein